MTGASQKRALKNYRKRISARGLARFEVQGLPRDKELIRSLAKQLAKNDSESQRLRDAVRQGIKKNDPSKGGVLLALLRSPLAGADLDLKREFVEPREIDL
jgi:hypothetical protein